MVKPQKTNKIPKVIIGTITADWCGHCQNMEKGFNEIETKLKSKYGKKILFIKIKDTEKDEKLIQLNKLYFKGKNVKTEIICEGFPTIFKIYNGTVDYYENGTNLTKHIIIDDNGVKQNGDEINKKTLQNWIENSFIKKGGGEDCGCNKEFNHSQKQNKKGGGEDCGCNKGFNHSQKQNKKGGWVHSITLSPSPSPSSSSSSSPSPSPSLSQKRKTKSIKKNIKSKTQKRKQYRGGSIQKL